MPQLMPLNWMFSSLMLVILIFMSGVVYSSIMGVEIQIMVDKKGSNKNLWWW